MTITETKATDRPLRAYRSLREQIIKGAYPQGTRLPEERLAAELEISRIPLREALSRLEVDGLIRAERFRGAVVETWTPKMVVDLFDVRLALEPTAAQLAARRIAQGADPALLHSTLADSKAAVARDDAFEIAEASMAFHAAIVAIGGNDIMAQLMRSVTGRTAWLFYLTSSRDPAAACEEHHRMLDAIESTNTRLAEAVAYAHIERGREPSLNALFPDPLPYDEDPALVI